MPKRADIKSILIIGAGPIVIGQACEFDYAGTQACKALKEEGYRVVLVNSNPATIMTDAEIADATYIEPITVDTVEQIIQKERPDAILPILGGQTALNCTLALAKAGILEKYNVKLLGATVTAIELAENRKLFQALMKEIGLQVPHAVTVHNLEEAKAALSTMTLPVVIRPSFTLGGSGAGIAKTPEEFLHFCEKAFAASPVQEVMIDEALIGWKEFELEVVRDKNDNCIIVCGVENIDPLGIHTGDSITVAPIQTLTDKEYQVMRQAAFAVLRAVGVDTGGSNVQFAVHPKTGKMVVIEMNPRVSRSSALVSKASGFPIAKIAAKLAVGYTLDELKNDITGNQLPASFEPSLDYVVVKIPRFNHEKFPETSHARGPQMLSVGEVMAIGRTFVDALQKAMRSLELGLQGFGNQYADMDVESLKHTIQEAGPLQILAIGEAFRRDMSLLTIQALTHMDIWFLSEIKNLIDLEKALAFQTLSDLKAKDLNIYKKHGFSDMQLANLLNCSEQDVATLRTSLGIHPVYKRVDSCAGEFIAPTAYLYSSYESICEAQPSSKEKVIVIGSGPNRIGQGIEFDYSCVQAVKALAAAGYESIMINCNPETVSTDYDVVDRLYCSPLTLEDVLEIIRVENPKGVLLQYGGQTPLQLVDGLAAANVPLWGVNPEVIHQTEDRYLFQQLLQKLSLKQPKNACIYNLNEGLQAAKDISFPLIVRPSFVLGGAAMSVVNNNDELITCLQKAFAFSTKHPVLIEEYLLDAHEIDVDAITDGEQVFIPALLEHIEAAGIHSGDSACITPPVNLSKKIQQQIKNQVALIASYLKLKGVFNVQLAVKENSIYIIEVNPRVSRTLPFLCKATGLPLVQMATQCVLGEKLSSLAAPASIELPFYCVKEVVLPFNKFIQSPALLGPEMKSTGEVMGIGDTPEEAYAKAQMGAGNILPRSGIVNLIATLEYQQPLQILADKLQNLGFIVFQNDHCTAIEKSSLLIAINDLLNPNKKIEEAARIAVNHKICHATTLKAAYALVDAMAYNLQNNFTVAPIQKKYQLINYKLKPKHLLTGEELTLEEIHHIIAMAKQCKISRHPKRLSPTLKGHQLALLFDKPSLRTRLSFAIAIQELGGSYVESVSSTRKSETPEDQMRVLNGYCHAVMVRTHEDSMLEKMMSVATIPIINGLSNLYHPCQVLGDLMTLQEQFGSLKGLTLAYIGDGNNILHSLLLLAPQMGLNIHYACPPTRGPSEEILAKSKAKINLHTGQIKSFSLPIEAVKGADAVYTDVWTSMGFEEQSAEHLFAGFQVNEALMEQANADAVFMHCLPMERGKEVSESLPDLPCSIIFHQSENRLHIQKAILLYLLGGN